MAEVKPKTAVLLINVGTPDAPDVKSVRKYLFRFLNDRRVIDLPWLFQKMLVNLIIVPFRAPKSTKLYKRLWTENGSPLIYYTEKAKDKLQKNLPGNFTVFNTMRYGNPGFAKALKSIKKGNFSKLVVLPMFPQYASSTSGTAIQAVMGIVTKWYTIPEIHIINQFYNNAELIAAFAKQARSYHFEHYDHIIFSYHGLPLRQVDKSHPEISCRQCSCTESLPEQGKFCYKATCYETSRLIAKELGLQSNKYTVSFQSRLSKDWLEPFTDKTIVKLAKSGCGNLLVIAPAFVADCLETLDEVGVDYKSQFIQNGGKGFLLLPGLNDMDSWILALKNIIISSI